MMVKGLTVRVAVIIIALTLLLSVWLPIKHWLFHPPTMPTLPMPVMALQYQTIPVKRTYIGLTQSISSVDIRARVKGFLTEMRFIEGRPVKAGQLLFVIDPRPFEAKLAAAEGALAKSLANEAFQKVQYERMKILVVKGDISQSYHDEVKARYEEAKAQVMVERANVEEAKINLSYCYMYAPFDGVIGEKKVDVGNLVGGDGETLLATVVQLNPIYIQFSPSISDFTQMIAFEKNRPFKATIILPEDKKRLFTGKVELVNNQATVDTASILMRATIDNPKNLLLPGLYVQTTVHLGENAQTLCIPKAAITATQGQQFVFTVDKQGVVQVATIETQGEYQQQAIVKKGLKVGDIIVVSGIQKLKDGMKVIPQFKSSQAKA